MYYIGVDLGGTNIAAGVVDEQGKILKQGSVPTMNERHYSEIVRDMAELCKKITEEAGLSMSDIQGIGIGCPGSIDNKTGMVVYANNLKMDHTPLAAELKKYIDLPVNVENDANAAAMGEYVVNGGGADSFVFITLGTGVGGGVVIDGKLYRGFNGVGAELGHVTLVHDGVPCTCGNHGCWEAYASVTALIRQTKEAMEKHPDSLMCGFAEKEGKVSGRTAFEAAKKGDPAAQEVVDQYVRYVADGLVGVVNTFQPERLVIGGGISKEGDYLLNPIKEYVKKYDYNKYMPRTDISIATLFNEAGIIGAALSVR